MGKKKIRKGKKKVTERETKRQITEQKKKDRDVGTHQNPSLTNYSNSMIYILN